MTGRERSEFSVSIPSIVSVLLAVNPKFQANFESQGHDALTRLPFNALLCTAPDLQKKSDKW